MKRIRSSPSLVEELFEAGIVLPDRPNLSLELKNYRERNEFWSKDLEARRMLCPDLFLAGSNAINDDSSLYLNIQMAPELQQRFPLVPFETREDFRRFLETPTFYLVNWLGELEGDDLLGNEYRSLEFSVVFLRICPGNPMGEYEVYSQEELITTFIQYNDFVDLKWRPSLSDSNPTTRSKKMTPFEIARIEWLLQSLLEDYPAVEALLDVIEGIRTGLTHRLQVTEELRSSANEEMKEFFYLILYVGMRMRGWSGEGPYPLKSVETLGKVDDIALIDQLIDLLESPKQWLELPLFNYVVENESLATALPGVLGLEPIEPFPDIDPSILEEPLEPDGFNAEFEHLLREMAQQERELDELIPTIGEFRVSTSSQEGLTILERILIILKNDDYHSCIRLSSRWFCSTAWYYLHFYFGIEPFRLEDLSWIS